MIISERMPVLPLRGLTVFPRQLVHFDVGREKSVKALEVAMKGDQRVFLVTQKDILDDDPRESGLYRIGTVGKIKQVLRTQGDMVRVLVEASFRISKQAMLEEKYSIADEIVEEKIIEAIIPGQKKAASSKNRGPFDFILGNSGYLSQKEEYEQQQQQKEQTENAGMDTDLAREQVRQQLREGLLEEQYIEIQVTDAPKANNLDLGKEGMSIAIGNIFGDMAPKKMKNKKVKVKDARKIL